MTIFFILPNLSGGGAERVVTSLASELAKSELPITLVLLNANSVALENNLDSRVRVTLLNKDSLLFGLPSILRLIWKERPKLVMSTLDHVNIGMSLMRPLFPPGTKLIIRATDFLNLKKYAFAKLMRLSFSLADARIFQSTAMKSAFCEKLHIGNKKRNYVLHNPVKISSIRSVGAGGISVARRPGTHVLVAAGRLTYAKGFDILIKALSLCAVKNIDLHVLGDGDDRSMLEKEASLLGISERVFFHGFVSNPYGYIMSSDAFVLSSRFEGFPNVVLESIALGTPTICTPIPGLAEIFEGCTGMFITSDYSADALAREIDRFFCGDRPHIDAEALAHLDVPHVACKLRTIFREVASLESC